MAKMTAFLGSLAVAAAMSITHPTIASADDRYSAGDLYTSCSARKGSISEGLCAGFISGVAEMAIEMHSIDVLPSTFNPNLISAQLTCMPPALHIDTLISAFVRYFDRDKNGMQRIPAHYAVLMAMKATWPCRRQ